MPDQIIGFLGKVNHMPERLIKTLYDLLVIEVFPKKHPVLKKGQVCESVYFIKKGLVRCYRIEEGKEVTLWIMKENDVFYSVSSFLKQQPGHEYIETLEPTEVGHISYETVQMLYKEFHAFSEIGRMLLERYYLLRDEHALALKYKNAEERYDFFLENHGELVNRVPVKVIASYLGIDEGTLSRIRGKRH